jgi:GNAT superfamily N-acetyltransferase
VSVHLPIPRQRQRPSAPPSGDWVIEPLRRGDVATVMQVFEGMSPRSRMQRFLSPMPRLTERMQARLSDVDGERHFAFGAWVRGRCIGISRAIVLPENSSVADIAVSVVDAHQGQGVGRMLVSTLAERAQALGICTFAVTVDPGNDAALALVRRVTKDAWFEEGVVRAEWKLPSAACI